MQLRTWTLGLAIALSAVACARTEPNSFIEKPVRQSNDLIRELKDPRVLDRYQRHFGMDKAELTAWFKTFKLTKLAHAGNFDEYAARQKGVLGKRRRRLDAGTLVFVNTSGTPILRKGCGNPIYRGTDRQVTKMPTPELLAGSGLKGFEGFDAQTPPVEVLSLIPDEAPIPVVAEAIPESPEPVAAPEPMVPVSSPVAPTRAPLLALQAAPIGNGLLGALSFSGGLVPFPYRGHSATTPEPVPEPGSLLVLASAAAAYAKRRRKA